MTSQTQRFYLGCAAVLGACGVLLGAFGAHSLADRLSPADMVIYRTASFYHLTHALALAVCASLMREPVSHALAIAAWAFGLGIVVFSGSLYLLVVLQWRTLGALTPVGGLSLIVGWLALSWYAWSARSGH